MDYTEYTEPQMQVLITLERLVKDAKPKGNRRQRGITRGYKALARRLRLEVLREIGLA